MKSTMESLAGDIRVSRQKAALISEGAAYKELLGKLPSLIADIEFHSRDNAFFNVTSARLAIREIQGRLDQMSKLLTATEKF